MCENPRSSTRSSPSSVTNPNSSPALSSRGHPQPSSSRQRKRKISGNDLLRFHSGRGSNRERASHDARYEEYAEYRNYDSSYVEYDTTRRGSARFVGSSSTVLGRGGGSSARLGRRGKYRQQSSFSTKEFLKASCNFILKRSFKGDLTEIKQIPWDDTLQVVCAAHEYRCPICLEKDLVLGRITTCGHIFCGPCLLHHLVSNANGEIPMQNGKYLLEEVFGQCPLCQRNIAFGRSRPATIRIVQKYSIGDTIDFVLVKRKKYTNRVELAEHLSDKIGIFQVYQLETDLVEEFEEKLLQLVKLLPSSHPVYEQPYMVAVGEQMKKSISEMRQERQSIVRSESSDRSDGEEDNESYLSKYKFVFQSKDGQYIFLDSFNYGMLKAQYRQEFRFPSEFSAKLLDKFSYVQTNETAAKFPWQKFVPKTATIEVVEVDLRPLLDRDVFRQFEKKFVRRTKIRQDDREREEKARQEQKQLDAMTIAERKALHAEYIPEEEFPDLMPSSPVERSQSASDLRSPSLEEQSEPDSKQNCPPALPPGALSTNAWFGGKPQSASSEPSRKTTDTKKKRRRRGRKKKERTPPLSSGLPPLPNPDVERRSMSNNSWSAIASRR